MGEAAKWIAIALAVGAVQLVLWVAVAELCRWIRGDRG